LVEIIAPGMLQLVHINKWKPAQVRQAHFHFNQGVIYNKLPVFFLSNYFLKYKKLKSFFYYTNMKSLSKINEMVTLNHFHFSCVIFKY
jgi:hypothetical protein